MIIPMLCVTIFVILVVWFLLPRVARLMIHTPTAISIFVCLSMVQLMAVFISMRCTLCGHFLQVALTLILVVGYAIAASSIACKIRGLMVTVCPSQFATRRTLFHVLVGCGLLMLKVSRLKLPVVWLLGCMMLNTLTKSQIWTLMLMQTKLLCIRLTSKLGMKMLISNKLSTAFLIQLATLGKDATPFNQILK